MLMHQTTVTISAIVTDLLLILIVSYVYSSKLKDVKFCIMLEKMESSCEFMDCQSYSILKLTFRRSFLRRVILLCED